MTASSLTTIKVSFVVAADDARGAEKVLDTLIGQDDERLLRYEVVDESYNGWANYSTWAVNLWLSNDEGLYRETLYRVGATMEEGRAAVADAIKGYVVDDLAPDLGASFAADLLGYALDRVDWFEIGDAWLEDVSAEVES